MEVVVYSKANCPQCVVVKRQLSLKGVDFKEVSIDTNKEIARWLVDEGHRTVPQVYVNGIHTNPDAITGEIVE